MTIAEGGKRGDRAGGSPDRSHRHRMAGGEVDRVEGARGGGPGTVGAARVRRDREPGDGSEFDPEGADGREDAVVGRVLEDEHPLRGVDLEELRRRRVAN